MNNSVQTLIELFGADLSRSDLSRSDLSRTNLSDANLAQANLTMADLTEAQLSRSTLFRANLFNATLTDANFTNAILGETVFAWVNLTATKGLDTCTHRGPSALDFSALQQSWPLPPVFLRGCGLPDTLINYLPSLVGSVSPIQFYSLVIRYSTRDHPFPDRLHADLQAKGVRCWFAPHDMQPGKKLHDQIDSAIRVYDRLLLLLSSESMNSWWVQMEVTKAREEEQRLGQHSRFSLR